MADLTLTELINVRTDKFDRAVPAYLNNEVELLKLFNKAKVVGFDAEKLFKVPFQYQMGQGTAWSGEGLAVPGATNPAFEQMYLGWKKLVGTIQLTEESLDLTKGANTFINAFARVSSDMLKVTASDVNTALHRRGTGAVAQSTGDDSGQEITMDTTRYLQRGMVLDGYDASDNKDAAAIVITKIVGLVVTVTGTITSVDANTVFYKTGSWVTGLDRAPMGIDGIIDDDTGTFQGLSRGTYPELKAHVEDGSTPGTPEALTLQRMRDVMNAVTKGAYEKSPDAIYTTIESYDKYCDILQDNNQPVETIPANAGYPEGAKFTYKGKAIPLIASSKATPNTMFFMSKSSLFKYFGKKGWADRGGGAMQLLEGYLTYRGNYRMWVNFGTTFPEANGRLNDITE